VLVLQGGTSQPGIFGLRVQELSFVAVSQEADGHLV
jgi:hypothetical protein